MKPLLVATLTYSLISMTQGAGDNSPDLQKLQGTWTVTRMENDGKTIPKEELSGYQFVVKGERYLLKGGDNYQGALKLDSSKKPHVIEATFVDDQGKDKGRAHGIYELQGATLKICWREKGDERPQDFSAKAGSGARLMVFQKKK